MWPFGQNFGDSCPRPKPDISKPLIVTIRTRNLITLNSSMKNTVMPVVCPEQDTKTVSCCLHAVAIVRKHLRTEIKDASDLPFHHFLLIYF